MGMVDLRSEKEKRKGNGTYTHRETYMTEKADRQRGHAQAWTKRSGFFHDQVISLLIIGDNKGSASL